VAELNHRVAMHVGSDRGSQFLHITHVDRIDMFALTQQVTDHNSGDQLEKAGQSILRLLHKAAGVAEENSPHALDMPQKLSHQLRAAENRLAELEAEVEAYRDRAERAERWLHRVYSEIEERFLHQAPSDEGPSSTQRRRRAHRDVNRSTDLAPDRD
jgi:DNA repair exonuclease SbcCD ATPase subunit